MEAEGSGALEAAGAPASTSEAPASAPEAPRQPRRGPAPIASFDHDVSDESSPETKQAFRLPEIREIPAGGPGGDTLAAPAAGRARSHSTPAAGALEAPPAPRIDISRASSSSHHDSRDSSPELAMFAGDGADGTRQRLEAAFREDGALDLRSSTEELSFLEPAPGEPGARPAAADPPAAGRAPPPPVPPPAERRHSRKDSQSSEAALLAISGRTSRLSSVGSQCSAVSAMSRVSRLSVVSGVSRSPSPHRMLLETSFCGPKPIETDPEASAAAVAEHMLEIAKLSATEALPPADPSPPAPSAPVTAPPALDARDRREVRTEVTVEAMRAPPAPTAAPIPVPAPNPTPAPPDVQKEIVARARPEERKARPRVRREPSEPEVYKSRNKSKDIIRIKLRPDDEDEQEEESPPGEAARKPVSLALAGAAGPASRAPAPVSPSPSRRRSPSPLGPPSVSRKSSFCSLFKSRETIGSPDSPQAQEALRRKRSLTEGRARSKSRDRSATPTSTKIRGSVLSLFRTPRRSATAADSSPPSRATSPAPSAAVTDAQRRAAQDKLKYYEEAKNGIIHIPLRTPPEERGAGDAGKRSDGGGAEPGAGPATEQPRPASAPQTRERGPMAAEAPPITRKVLPDGSIIIPLHSPTERVSEACFPAPEPTRPREPAPRAPSPLADPPRAEPVVTPVSSAEASVTSPIPRPPEPEPAASPPEPPPPHEDTRKRRKERIVFTTHVGSREQVFSTQFSITKTPSITSEISGSFPSFDGGELRDTHIAADPPAPAEADTPPAAGGGPAVEGQAVGGGSGAVTPQDPPKDSSGSEPSSEAAPPPAGNEVERRRLVVQESFEEDLPYVPTTLPQERSVAVPMVPIRERGGVHVRSVQRPRAAPPAPTGVSSPAAASVASPAAASVPPPVTPRVPAAPPASADKLRIKLPRRPRVSSASVASARPSRERTRSGSGSGAGGDNGAERGGKQEWIDFEEVPERRKQPKRIQTLPVGAADEAGAGVVFNYVEPEQCRCECHAHAARAVPRPPLDHLHSSISTSSAECGEEETPAPFTTDLDLRHDDAHHMERAGARP